MRLNPAIAEVGLDTLTPFAGNARRGDIGKIAQSLKTNGQYRPIVVREETGEILAGNHTFAAAKTLGWDTIAVSTVSGLTDEQAKKIVLVDNKANDDAGYDEQALLDLLQSMDDLDGTGYVADDIVDLLSELNDVLDDERLDDVPDTRPDPICEEGDVWLLGPHRLVVGDSTDPEVVAKACGGRAADLVVTDPPYNVSYEGKTGEALTIQNDEMGDDQFAQFLLDAYTAMFVNTKPGGPIYVFHADIEGANFRQQMVEAGWLYKQSLVWVKNTFALGRQDYQWQHEPILYGWAPGAAHKWYGQFDKRTVIDDRDDLDEMTKDELIEIVKRINTTVIDHPKPARNAEHPTMKPVGLLTKLIENSSRFGDLVLDTFGGSGATLIAAHATSRVAATVELDPVYADVICRRFQDLTGILPVNEGTGQPVDFNN